jgi:ribosomal protein S18 acetylase RimI-like enzyme
MDVDALRRIYRASSMSNESDRVLFAEHPELLEWADDGVREGRTRVAVVDEVIVGFATLSTTDHAELEDLFVHPEWMRRGVARALVEDMASIAAAAGYASIEVDANPNALAFYRQTGFVELGEAKLEYGSGLRMRRRTPN